MLFIITRSRYFPAAVRFGKGGAVHKVAAGSVDDECTVLHEGAEQTGDEVGAELTAYRTAAAYFKANNITKLPSPKKLEAEYTAMASEKAKFYEQYKETKEEMFKLKTAKQNVASFFREEEQTQQER